MSTYNIVTRLEEDGTLTLNDLPFRAGEAVEVTVTSRSPATTEAGRYSLRGRPVQYIEPTEPVSGEDWEVLR